MAEMSRREWLLTLPALTLATRAVAQPKPQIQLRGFNNFRLAVADVKRSVDFYQGLFGMPVQARQGSSVLLRIGEGPHFMAIGPAGSAPPSIASMGLSVANFNGERTAGILGQHGLSKADEADAPMKYRVSSREGTPELLFRDVDGLLVQLQDVSYCGGSGPLGSVCSKIEPAPKKGPFAVKEISHFTNSMLDSTKANQFYQDLFGLQVRSKQGAALGLGVGPGIGFVMFTGGAGGGRGAAAPKLATINHVCMNLPNFNVDAILKTLAGFGITPRGENPPPGPVGAMKSYISMRMPNRGGAEGGTPELYFTDPDGLLIQLQDVTYCGGGGYLGNEQCV